MSVLVSMLRGVNVGGHHRIKMDALRTLYESLDLQDPQTYVQSGNVIFKTRERNLIQLAARIEDGIERTFGFRPAVILRTTAELREVAASNPFALRSDFDHGKLLVMFLASDPGPELRAKVLGIRADPEELRVNDRELYIYFPNGMGRSKLSTAAIEKTLQTSGTGRNWNSVTKLLEIAEKMQSPR